jgi:SpoVK/Ycf46/Vps4 family AAA+-type ATPase
MLQQEIDIQLKRLSLDAPKASVSGLEPSSHAVQVVQQEARDVQQQCELPTDPGTASDQLSGTDEPPGEQGIEQALEELDKLVGLSIVKREVRTLTNFLRMQQHRKSAGLPQQSLNLHMVFKGNPGTGKTTVARIIAKILHQLGILNRGHLVETDRSGLVAEYAGQTGPKTNRRIDEALDGVLFIDEAYSLVAQGNEDAFGAEAVQALIKRMEDDRERLVVILAGYPEPMDSLLRSNPGMSSRFNIQMTFDDYEPPELANIYQRMCEANQYVLTHDSRVRLLVGFHHAYHQRDEHFGNGRLVRNVFEMSVRKLANRIAGIAPITHDLLTTLTAEDIDFDRLPEEAWSILQDQAFRIQIVCPECQQAIRIKPVYLGKRIKCPKCRRPVEARWGKCISKPPIDQ